MQIFIGADHGGFRLKKEITRFLKQRGETVVDIGNTRFQPTDDYPDFALPLARQVSKTPGSRGILVCRNGVGVCIAANKVTGIRAVLSSDLKHVRSSRHDDDTNVLCLGQDFVSPGHAKKIVSAWLVQRFSGASRHRRRLQKIRRFEQ